MNYIQYEIGHQNVKELCRKRYKPNLEWANVSFGIHAQDFLISTVLLTPAQTGRLMRGLCRAAVAGDAKELLSWPFITNVKKGTIHKHRPAISPLLRRAVVERDGGRCRRCNSDDDIQLDHIKPWVYGGRHTLSNLQVLCAECNRLKGPTAWATLRKPA